ncbi:MAG: glycosyltransferase family 4 protein [Microscillaceae bacterium]
MFGWEYPPHITGGLGTACFGLTEGLAQTDLDLLFVVPKAYGDEDQHLARIIGAGEIEVKRKHYFYKYTGQTQDFVQVNEWMLPMAPNAAFYEHHRHQLLDTSDRTESEIWGHFHFEGRYGTRLYEEVENYALVAAEIARQHDFDLIHAHDWLTYEAGIMAKKISGKPLVVHVHATEFDRSGRFVNQEVFDIEKKGMEAADRVLTVSNLTKKIAVEKYGIPAQKITTVYNAVKHNETTSETFTKNTDDKIVTFLGRITLQKGPEYFVEAAKRVIERMPKVRFVMAGSGDMLPRMVKRVAELGIAERFHFTGFLQGAEVDQMLAMSDVYVMPSVSEPFGISPLEAMRNHVPVIISRQSGVSEILKYAIKIDFWDIEAMADAIYGLLNYKGLSRMFRKYGKDEVDSLRWEKPAREVRQIYETLCLPD